MPSTTVAPILTHVAELVVEVGEPITVGQTSEGIRRVVPILGGTMRGTRFNGAVLAAGADYQLIRPDGFTTLDARYVVRMDDGALLFVVNVGVRFGPWDVMADLVRGEPVDPALVYFRTMPRFETASPVYAWLERPLFLLNGNRQPDKVVMDVFEVE